MSSKQQWYHQTDPGYLEQDGKRLKYGGRRKDFDLACPGSQI